MKPQVPQGKPFAAPTFGASPVPLGRLREVASTIPPEVRSFIGKKAVGWDYRLIRFASRRDLLAAVAAQDDAIGRRPTLSPLEASE